MLALDQEDSLARARELLTEADQRLDSAEEEERVSNATFVPLVKNLVAATREMHLAVAGANWTSADQQYVPLERVTFTLDASDRLAAEAGALVEDIDARAEAGDALDPDAYKVIVEMLKGAAHGFARAMLNAMRDQAEVFAES